MLTLIAAVAVIASSEPDLPDLRVRARDLTLSETAGAREFARRVSEGSRDYCAAHLEALMPEHMAQPKLCERAMAGLVVTALPETRRRDFRRAGGPRELARLQR